MGISKKKCSIEKDIVLKRKPGRPPKTLIRIITKSTMEYIKKVESLNLDGNIAENWRKFKQSFEIFTIAAELSEKSEAVRIGVFLNAIGPEAVEVFNSFNLSEENKKKYKEVIKAFDDFCKPKKNEVYESYIFHGRQQAPEEPFDSFLMDLKKLVKTCGFGETEERMVRDRIVFGIADKQTQKRLLETENLNLEKAV